MRAAFCAHWPALLAPGIDLTSNKVRSEPPQCPRHRGWFRLLEGYRRGAEKWSGWRSGRHERPQCHTLGCGTAGTPGLVRVLQLKVRLPASRCKSSRLEEAGASELPAKELCGGTGCCCSRVVLALRIIFEPGASLAAQRFTGDSRHCGSDHSSDCGKCSTHQTVQRDSRRLTPRELFGHGGHLAGFGPLR